MAIGFIGEYESTLDQKGRFLLPAAFKKKMPEDSGNTFVISRGLEKCLTLYPKQNWDPIFEKLSQLNDFDPNVRQFTRRFLNGAIEVEMDGAGRLNLPNTLKAYAGLDKDITLVSAINKIEIWDTDTYKKLFEDFSPSEFSELAAQVMGGKTAPVSNPLSGII